MIRARLRRGIALLAPLALVGCDHAYTASDYATRGGTEASTAPRIDVVVPAKSSAIAAWQLPSASPWAPYEKMTLLSALGDQVEQWELPDVASMPDVVRASLAGQRMAAGNTPSDAAVFVDLRGAASVAFARAFNQTTTNRLSIVPTFNNWPHDDELVPAEDTLAAMITMMPPPALDPGAHPMFLLDAWRLAYTDEEVDEDVFDNRYALNAGDLPTADALLAQGVRRIVYVVEGTHDSAREEDDLNELFLDYEARGIDIAIVGIDDLLAVPEGWSWDQGAVVADESIYVGFWPRWRCHVRSRGLVIHSPSFYGRSQGGWGGAHGFGGFHGGMGMGGGG